jgi:hypothetical protein
MASKTWTGGANNGNLSSAANYSGGTLPVSNDTLTFNAGYVDITAGTTALSGIYLSAVIINEGFRASKFGTAASPVKLKTSKFQVTTQSLGFISVASPVTLTRVKADKLNGASLYIGSGTAQITELTAGKGQGYIEVADAVKVTALRSAGIGGKLGPCSSSPPDIKYRIGKGSIWESQRRMAVGVIDGYLKVTEGGSIAHTTSASAEAVVGNGGRLTFAATASCIRIEQLPGSLLDFEGAKANVTIGEHIPHDGSIKAEAPGITVTIGAQNPVGYPPSSSN